MSDELKVCRKLLQPPLYHDHGKRKFCRTSVSLKVSIYHKAPPGALGSGLGFDRKCRAIQEGIISFGFRLYLHFFDSDSKSYGPLGAVIVLMLWLYSTGVAVLIGGKINSEIETAAAEKGAATAMKKGEKSPRAARAS